jgi:putative ABC transport system permease protein
MLTRLLTLRSMRARPLRMLLSTFGIVLGVACIVAIGIANQTALQSITRLFNDTSGRANLIVVSASSAKGERFTESVLRRTAGMDGVAVAIPSFHAQTVLAKDAAAGGLSLNFFGVSLGGLTLYGIDPVLDTQARQYTISSGQFLSSDPNADDVVLVDTYAKNNDITLGKHIQIVTADGLADLRVVGLMAKEGPGQINNGAFGVLPLKTAQRLFDQAGQLDQVDIIAQPTAASADALENLRVAVQQSLGKSYSVLFPATQGKRMAQMLDNYQIGLNFLSGMALFVGAFLIYNAFSMTVVERTREFGLLRTLGMTRRQVVRQVLTEALLLGIGGSLLGLALGILMARGISRLFEVVLAQDMRVTDAPPGLALTALAVGIVMTVLSAGIPAWQAGRVSPLEALRVRARSREGWLMRYGWVLGLALLALSTVLLVLNPFPYDVQFRLGSVVVVSLFLGGTLVIPGSVGVWERLSRPLVRRLYGNSGRLGSRNIERSKLRTTLTVAALMIGVAMVIIVRGMTESFAYDIRTWLNAYIGGDLFISSSAPLREDARNRIESVAGVDAIAPVRYFEVKWLKPDGNDESLNFMATDPLAHSRVTSFVYSQDAVDTRAAVQELAQGDALFISSVLAEKYKLKVGDLMTLRTRRGLSNFRIAAVIVDFYNQGLSITGSWNDMRRYFNLSSANGYLVRVHPGVPAADVQQRIDALYGKRDHLSLESNQALKGRVDTLMSQAFSMFDVLALIAILVGAMGIINTLTMNVMERTQELGMLRGIGMLRRQVVMMILAEAGLMGVIGAVMGLLFGVVLTRIFLTSMTAMSGYKLTFVISAGGLLAGLIVGVLISQLAALLPARRAARIRLLEAIHYE